MRPRLLSHPLVVRLLAVVLAVSGAGAATISVRAPQALRAWTDTAAEVAPASRTRATPAQLQHARRQRHPTTTTGLRTTTPAWAAAAATAAAEAAAETAAAAAKPRPAPPPKDLRLLLALKQSRLI